MTKEELHLRLATLRESLKMRLNNGGRAPVICSDATLEEMARRAPRTKTELAGITGVGATFLEKYADSFMVVLNEYHKSNASTRFLNEEVRGTLKNLENRLVNISKRNRLLYMGRLYNNYAVDMHATDETYNQKVLDLLFGKAHQLVMCELKKDSKDTSAEKRFKQISRLLREVTHEYRDSGQYDLYIGYPFIEGRTRGENFDVRAPLVLFPVAFEKKPDKITIKINKDKDILYNTNLILMQNKFINRNVDLPENVLDNLNRASFYEDVVNYYKDNEIEIILPKNHELNNFVNMTQEEFPQYNNGEFYMKNNAVLGRFSLYSSALQKDFKKIANATEINGLLDELLVGMGEGDFYADSTNDTNPQAAIDFSEKDLHYINELNSSQEQSIISADKHGKLVIQGPPGTGKSQVIASLIADVVNKGKTVAVVSQKRTALDVIYSRLGTLSDFTMLLSDVKDKEVFYKQASNLLTCDKDSFFSVGIYNTTASDIDANVDALDEIAEKLYKTKVNNVELYKLYQENQFNYFKNNKEERPIYEEALYPALLDIDYYELKKIKEKFTNPLLLDNCKQYIHLAIENPWLKEMLPDIKAMDRRNMIAEITNFCTEQQEYLGYNPIKRFFKKGKRKRAIKAIYKKYFAGTKTQAIVWQNPQAVQSSLELYSIFQGTKKVFQTLSHNEQMYVNAIYEVLRYAPDDINNISQKLYDYIIFYLICDFENDNRLVVSNIYNFSDIVAEISTLIAEKKELTKKKLRQVMSQYYQKEILNSKRFMEINRQLESTRKWSVAKFVNKFSLELFAGIRVWLMTPETVSEILPLQNGLFDYVVFDEASQLYIERGVPAISRAKKVVIAGDHKQLRPSNLGFGRLEFEEELEEDEETNAALEEESLLDLARFKYPSVLLDYHYRSKYEELINFSNYAFYRGKLNISPNIVEPETSPIEVVKVNNGKWIDRCNPVEAQKVVELVKNIFATRKNNETMGIITFNRRQEREISEALDKEARKDTKFASVLAKEYARKENGEDIGLFVRNIERVQGDERDIIIFSTAYAKNEEGKVVRNFGWLNQQGGENRLNVAISRSKRKIYLVTSIMPEELPIDGLKNDGPKIFRKYLEYCWAIHNKDHDAERRILLSFVDISKANADGSVELTEFEQDVLTTLRSKGLNVEPKVGVGGYKIDFGIKDASGKKYVLGVECDGKLYSSSMCTRERDLFRQKYLVLRGWNIHRIWSPNWWKNKDAEVNKIIELYNSLLTK